MLVKLVCIDDYESTLDGQGMENSVLQGSLLSGKYFSNGPRTVYFPKLVVIKD